ncbi:MAG: ATP-binding protein, partial [Chloroflexales bacterium]|nr:ATP-binding protein [Chloroflexales bacterium]
RLWQGPLPPSREAMLAGIADARRDPDDPRYSYVVLELRCFNDWVWPYHTSDIWEQPHLLPGSKSQHYRDFDRAVKHLAAILLDSLRPVLRPERPRHPETLYGYEQQLAALGRALASGCTVALSGPGGVGKTSLAAAALACVGNGRAFWYTLRPGFNDGASSLLIALGVFLHEQGASNLWQYLVTANSAVGDLNLAAGLLRQDLATLEARQPILCFDDLEHLAAGNLTLLSPAYAQLLDLIEGLRGSAALLLISQRSLPACDLHLDLGGLNLHDVERLCAGAGHTLSGPEVERLYTYTGGNPRLVTLLLALRTAEGTPLSFEGEKVARSLLPAFQRLWLRLTPEERRSLQRLAVYQGYAPEDLLPQSSVSALVRLRLIERDGSGGVAVLPPLPAIILDEISPELREKLHSEAAKVRLERGEYTAAAFHFARSGQEDLAVQAWFPQRQQAVARGEADAALTIFGAISRQRLDRQERKALDIIRTELRQLIGQRDEALRDLEQADWSDLSEANARLWMLRGEMQDALGYPDSALESYAEGLTVTARLLGQVVALRQRRGLLFYRRRDLAASWSEIHRAQFELGVLRGLVRQEEGAYDDSLEAFRAARELAEQLDDDSLRAQAERWLASVYGRRQQLAEAVAHGGQAIATYERLGDRVNLEKMRSNLAFIYVQTQQFQLALDVGAPAYAFFIAVRDTYFASATGANLAEASFELGDLAGAARYAAEVLDLGHRHAAPYARFTLGQIDLAQHNPAAAIDNFSESMQLAQSNNDPYMVAYAQRALGQASLAANDAETAQRHVKEALDLFRQLDIAGEIAATERLMAEVQAFREHVTLQA